MRLRQLVVSLAVDEGSRRLRNPVIHTPEPGCGSITSRLQLALIHRIKIVEAKRTLQVDHLQLA